MPISSYIICPLPLATLNNDIYLQANTKCGMHVAIAQKVVSLYELAIHPERAQPKGTFEHVLIYHCSTISKYYGPVYFNTFQCCGQLGCKEDIFAGASCHLLSVAMYASIPGEFSCYESVLFGRLILKVLNL